MTSTINNVIARASAEIGGFYPGNSLFGNWYAEEHGAVYKNAQFCAMGLSWVFYKEGALDIFPKHAYTPSGVNWFKAKKRWHSGSINEIKRGDILYFNFPGAPDRVSHVGIAERDGSGGRVQTIEFNTSGTVGGNQRNGRVVARKIRSAHIVGWGRPAYQSEKAAKVPAKNKSIAQLVDEVLAGKHGNGAQRHKSLGTQYTAVRKELNKRLSKKAKPAAKSVSQLVDEVLANKHGSGETRKKSLGSNYKAVQAEINKRFAKPAKKSIYQLADEVLANKHGSGEARKKSLGSNYKAVQAEVNKQLRR